MLRLLLILSILLIHPEVWGQSKIALVKLVRGDVTVTSGQKSGLLQVDDWISRGSIIKTAEKSFVKLIFIDKSQVNIGPNTEMKVEAFSGKDAGIIDLVKGKVRSQVTKDYLQMQDKGRSKLFIKTTNAVMGVRGTDFLISTNSVNTTTILFEGEVLLNRLDERNLRDSTKLEEIVERGVRILPGEFSVVEAERTIPTIPAILNIQQRERLEKNVEMNTEREPSNTEETQTKNVIPEGLNGKVVSNNPEILKKEIVELVKEPTTVSKKSEASSSAEGFVKGDQIKPANGSVVHVDSGVIISPGKGAVLDPHTNTYIPEKDIGKISGSGNYIPPQNMEITSEGKVFVAVKTEKGEVVREVKLPPPIIASSGMGAVTANIQPGNPKENPHNKPVINPVKPPIDLRPDDLHYRPVSGGVVPNSLESAAANGSSPTTIIIQDR